MNYSTNIKLNELVVISQKQFRCFVFYKIFSLYLGLAQNFAKPKIKEFFMLSCLYVIPKGPLWSFVWYSDVLFLIYSLLMRLLYDIDVKDPFLENQYVLAYELHKLKTFSCSSLFQELYIFRNIIFLVICCKYEFLTFF